MHAMIIVDTYTAVTRRDTGATRPWDRVLPYATLRQGAAYRTQHRHTIPAITDLVRACSDDRHDGLS